MEPKQITLHKIPLSTFIDLLVEVESTGAAFIDIIGIPDIEQDVIGIAVKDEYIVEEEEEHDDDLKNTSSDDYVIKKQIKLTDDDISKLIDE
jgi:uncharacterized membrane-anchored protein